MIEFDLDQFTVVAFLNQEPRHCMCLALTGRPEHASDIASPRDQRLASVDRYGNQTVYGDLFRNRHAQFIVQLLAGRSARRQYFGALLQIRRACERQR